ncbi:MAG: class I SAM-dependent methyltransferase [Candidatus Marinimicrobia bacterium]|nr:class I SAM-dependent methyltransferase [Candidatus Neomarinimicrobiota bacterium]
MQYQFSKDSLGDRVEREKVFHEKRYVADDPRKVIHGIYRLAQDAKSHYYELLCQNINGKVILELGCGKGDICLMLSEQGATIFGIDISPIAINEAKKRSIEKNLKSDFRIMDAENLDFEDGSFDIIFGAGILHHLNLEKSLKEIKRVL